MPVTAAAARAWYLVYSKPRQERAALENLDRQGYETYLPLVRVRRRRERRYATVVEPMFPRYLFVHLGEGTDDWGPIRSTIGVTGLVRFGGVPARVPDELIAALRMRDDEEGIQSLPALEPAPGDRVRVVEGPFAGYEAIFEARRARDRVSLLLDIAGRLTRLEAGAGDIEGADPQRSSPPARPTRPP